MPEMRKEIGMVAHHPRSGVCAEVSAVLASLSRVSRNRTAAISFRDRRPTAEYVTHKAQELQTGKDVLQTPDLLLFGHVEDLPNG